MKKKILIFILVLFFIFATFFIHASIEYFEVKNVTPINNISLKKLKKINFNNNNIKVGIIGDTKEGIEIFKKLVEKAKNNGCKFIIHTGDIIRFNDLRYYKYVYEEVKELIEKENIPIFVLPGNHDTWRHSHRGYSIDKFNQFFGKMPLILNINDNAFVLINDSKYTLNVKSVEQIKNYFNTHKINKKFLFAHVPTRDPRPNSYHCLNGTVSKSLKNFIKKNEFNAIFFSHIHSYYTYKIKNIPCYISGGGGASLWKGNYHYLQLNLTENSYNVTKENISWIYGLDLVDFIKMRSMEWIPFKNH